MDVAARLAVLHVGAEDGGRGVHEDLGAAADDRLELGDGGVAEVLADRVLAHVEGEVLLGAQSLEREKRNDAFVQPNLSTNCFKSNTF